MGGREDYTSPTMEWWIFWLVAAILLAAGEIHTQAFYLLFRGGGRRGRRRPRGRRSPSSRRCSPGLWPPWEECSRCDPPSSGRWEGRLAAPYRFPGLAGGLVGAHAVTVDTVGDEHHPGHALLGNERWLAITDAAEPLPSETPVVVAAVRGTTLLARASGAPRLQ